ncbi:P1 family peptidase [Polyangium spumosum]|uniref:S58 family peptidase n=1 Tax=Polyangium spumosum TaxID=889282 RepID=A0A6N7PUN8_9BACT|nr:P1 family peptidase [Polyangium spumosum]MRG93794.1 S58 family peptidase [Polyangium spumosum]
MADESDLGKGRTVSRRVLLAGGALAALEAAGCNVLPAEVPRAPAVRRRIRDLGIAIGALPPGRHNAITDVPGVRVGHLTRIEGEGPLVPGRGPIRTGVTVIMPGDDVWRDNLPAARFTLNGNGELTGVTTLDRRGLLETPIFLTDTSNIGRVMDGALAWMLETYPEIGDTAPVPTPIVGETWAAFLHDAEGRHLTDAHVREAILSARGGPVEEGAVGGGTGMLCYEFKGGIGTASRRLPASMGSYTLGVLVQANHGRRHQLRIDGVPVGREITEGMPFEGRKTKSILIIGATDAPMTPVQLGRLAKRMALGLGRTGAVSMHGSGDLLLFFSTGVRVRRGAALTAAPVWNDEHISVAHEAAVEATEEAVLNAMAMARTTTGIHGNTAYALPLDRLPDIMRKYGRPIPTR